MTNENYVVEKCQFESGHLKTVGLHFKSPCRRAVAIFTHGYTSCKVDQLYWAQRLVRHGIDTVIFDLPGHYLGSGAEVENFDDFAAFAPRLFLEIATKLHVKSEERLILGGHSLGALLALKAMELEELGPFKKFGVAVGFGLNAEDGIHPLEKSFFRETLILRSKLVSPALGPTHFFPWLHSMKKNLFLTGERLHFICGEDDMIVPKNGAEELAQMLRERGNTVTLEKPRRLPHHEPALAAPLVEDAVLASLA